MYQFIGDVLKVSLKFEIPDCGTPEYDALSDITKKQFTCLREVERKWWALPMRQLKRVGAVDGAGAQSNGSGGGDGGGAGRRGGRARAGCGGGSGGGGSGSGGGGGSNNIYYSEGEVQAAVTLQQLAAGPPRPARESDEAGPSGRTRSCASPQGNPGAGASPSKTPKRPRAK